MVVNSSNDADISKSGCENDQDASNLAETYSEDHSKDVQYVVIEKEEQIEHLPLSAKKKKTLSLKAKEIGVNKQGDFNTPISVKMKKKVEPTDRILRSESRSNSTT